MKRGAILVVTVMLAVVAIYLNRQTGSQPVPTAQPRGDIVFSDYSFTSEEALFSLTETASQHSSGWLKIGQSFAGHTVVSFDPAKEVITLKYEEELLTLPRAISNAAPPRIFFQVKTHGRLGQSSLLDFSEVSLKQVIDHFAAVSGRKMTVAPEIGVLNVTGHFRNIDSFLFQLPQIVPVRVEVGSDGSVQILPKEPAPTRPGEP